ncbi:MAG: SDR family NAD(P)-dependent oxidoreductase [Asticcacaulis sp.]|nr:SDR family NAD(P)-dependent oxidoreductase [Asticcacaulis sp.]
MTKTVFITGASAGFGRHFADEALRLGYNVVATARRLDRLQALAAQAPDRVLPLGVDVGKADTIAAAVDAAVERFGGIDVLINNAGYGLVGALEETPAEEWQDVFRTNLFGAVETMRAVLPVMRRQRSGTIVNISSMGGQLSFAGFSAYSATKFALEGASEALVEETKHLGIRVMIVEPGAFRTDFASGALRHMPEIADYNETVGPSRAFAHDMDNTQPGDPVKAAQAVFQAIASNTPPLRLALGNDAVDGIRAHAERVLKDLKDWEAVSRGAVFETETV